MEKLCFFAEGKLRIPQVRYSLYALCSAMHSNVMQWNARQGKARKSHMHLYWIMKAYTFANSFSSYIHCHIYSSNCNCIFVWLVWDSHALRGLLNLIPCSELYWSWRSYLRLFWPWSRDMGWVKISKSRSKIYLRTMARRAPCGASKTS